MKRRQQYQKDWIARKRRRAVIDDKRCKACGAGRPLILLDERPKDELSTKELVHVEALCPNCLLRDQPLLTASFGRS